MAQTQEEKHEALDRDLAGIVKILAGVFLVIAGVGTAFGLSQHALLVAVNNDLGLFIGVGILALLAVGLSVVTLFFKNNKKGNVWQLVLLGVGVTAYLAALVLTVAGVASYATGHGRPNITNVSVVPGSPAKVNFTVHADGVKGNQMLIVEAEAFNEKVPINGNPLYRTVLHADDNGDIEQKVEFVMEKGDATRLTIQAFPEHGYKDGPGCESGETSDKLGCATVVLPPSATTKKQ
ncbi:hypothetical protein [Streptomyces virginiae]|uniref:hypothetical protein n=1 Tax=Streptomyces virginiae TaxID=1961 RepID=UPI0022530206|nr:hypothetical protein [Streptomyces virginiae]MCX4956876.1 hypothetical protein [Streptomyces virginiae]